jgi:hypothetical protein
MCLPAALSDRMQRHASPLNELSADPAARPALAALDACEFPPPTVRDTELGCEQAAP